MNKQTIMRMMASVALVFATAVGALADTTFKITDGVVDEKVKAAMEANVTALIMTFHDAAEKGEKTIKLSKDNV